MLLDSSTTWPSQDLMWQMRFMVKSSSHLWVRTMEEFLALCKNQMYLNKQRTRDLHVADELIFHNALLHDDNWCFEVTIAWRGPVFNLLFYGRRLQCQFIKITKVHQLTLTENLFIRFGCSVISFLESWKLGMLVSLTGRRRFSCSLLGCGHGWKMKSSKESDSESLIYGLKIWIYLCWHCSGRPNGPWRHTKQIGYTYSLVGPVELWAKMRAREGNWWCVSTWLESTLMSWCKSNQPQDLFQHYVPIVSDR